MRTVASRDQRAAPRPPSARPQKPQQTDCGVALSAWSPMAPGPVNRPRTGVNVAIGVVYGALRRALTEMDAAVPLGAVRTLREQRNRNAAAESLATTIGVTLGGAALGLAAIGLFAAMSAAVARRTRE